MMLKEILLSTIEAEKQLSDHVIIYPHWGTELVDSPDPKDVLNARRMIDSGASLIVGHHPHVVQGIERYKHGFIAYSLGSFIYMAELEDGYSPKLDIKNLSACLNITLSKNAIISYKVYKYQRCEGMYSPELIGDFSDDPYFLKISENIGDNSYYTSTVRKVLLKRELYNFFYRLKNNPVQTIVNYISYIKLKHVKKILGFN